jgi:hypothetical protein
MILKGTGNLGIGTTSPSGKLQVVLPAYTSEDTDSQQAIFGSGTSGHGVRIGYNEATNAGYITSLKPGVAWSRLSLQGSSIVFAPTAVERVRVTTDGLTFNGDTAAANALDDYEEGTFTPDIRLGSWAFGARSGFYTKIGNLVTVNLLIVWTANNAPSGDAFQITLPFAAFGTGNFRAPAAIGYTSGISFNTSRQLVAHVDMAQAYISFQQIVSGGAPTGLTTADINGSGETQISVTYQV